MTVLCWNCQGIGNSWTVKGLKGLVTLNVPKIIFLSETRCTVSEMVEVRKELGWRNCFSVNCRIEKKQKGKRVSRAGGISLLWSEDVRVSLRSYSDSHIDVTVRNVDDDMVWRFTGVYGQPKVENRHLTWAFLKQLKGQAGELWVLGGDFNEITSYLEKWGGPIRSEAQMEEFRVALEECGLDDLRFEGPKFTWKGKRGGKMIKVRLDRFVASKAWQQYFSAFRVRHLPKNESDHLPIILDVSRKKRRKRKRRRRFRFEEMWLREKDCRDIVQAGWGSDEGQCPFSILTNKLQRTREMLLDWSRDRFGKLAEDIKTLRDKLGCLYDDGDVVGEEDARVELEKQLRELLEKEQVFWQQRSKVLWLAEGDLNTKYFHQKASNRRKKNTLRGLFNRNGVWVVEDDEIQEVVVQYYSDLFKSENLGVELEDVGDIPTVISEEANRRLVHDITEDEILRALKQMHPSKAPGPDGFSPAFYKQFWDVVGCDVVRAIKCFLQSEEMLQEVNCTWVTLIPKVKKPKFVEQLRPISLCNVVYKIGSKLLANRMKGLLNDIISPYQSAFVPGRLISDNSLLAFEISHFLKRRRRGKVGYGALKLDMRKAYDRVEWRFLEVMMIKIGFCRRWVDSIMRCVRTVSYSFIINGDPIGRVVPTRGLRQGDAISPYLFVICAEYMSRQLLVAESRKEISGVKVCAAAPPISHLFFADDSFVFFKADDGNCNKIRLLLQRYEILSGQQVNYEKSEIAFSRNVPRWRQQEVADELGVKRVDRHKKYLGLPAELSHSKTEAFKFLCDRMRKRTQGWRDKVLSQAGKEVLIKSVVQSIPTYVMSCFEIPKHLCTEMHRWMARFWWGDSGEEKKMHWLAWERMCVPKCEGGLGFRDMGEFNRALLAKQAWRLLRTPDSPLARVLRARYFPSGELLEVGVEKNCSFTWRSILKGLELLRKGIRFQVGNGESINVWDDPWIPVPYSFRPYSLPMEGTEDMKVCELIDQEWGGWNYDVLQELLSEGEVDQIGRIPLGSNGGVDRYVWHFDKKGVYSVKQGYHVAREVARLGKVASTSGQQGQGGALFRRVWRANVPPKVRLLAWKVLRGVIPTRVALVRRHVNLGDDSCVLCGGNREDVLHLFFECRVAQQVWSCSNIDVGMRRMHGRVVEEWFAGVLKKLNNSIFEQFLTLLWGIWEGRNNLLWNGRFFNLRDVVQISLQWLEEYRQYHGKHHSAKKGRRRATKWLCPPQGRLKVNVDGSFLVEHGCGGLGVVIRDETGTCMAAMSRPIDYAQSVIHVEAEALRAGMLLAIHQGWDNVEVETDCAVLVDALKGDGEDLSMIGRIVEDCRRFASSFLSFECRHINREANGVANRLAHLATWTRKEDTWFEEAPAIIRDALFEDSCIIDRGIGIMSPQCTSVLIII